VLTGVAISEISEIQKTQQDNKEAHHARTSMKNTQGTHHNKNWTRRGKKEGREKTRRKKT
jgi:hypothetical protein